MGTAQSNQAAAMQNAPTPGFNATAFKAQLLKRIEDLTPKTTAQADEFKENNQLGAVKQDMGGQVTQERQKAQGPLEEKKDQAPDTKSVPPKPVTPLAAPDPGPAPGAMPSGGDMAPYLEANRRLWEMWTRVNLEEVFLKLTEVDEAPAEAAPEIEVPSA